MIDRKAFFDAVRKAPFGGPLSQGQVDGMGAILDEWDRRPAFADLRWLAYMLATTFHETARKMAPIHEIGGATYFNSRYGPATSVGKVLGNTQPGDGNRFHGRGYVQLTGRRNYTLAGQKLGVDLVGNPDLALAPSLAAAIMFLGMSEGWFTGKKLGDYITASRCDYTNARRIINGTDKAATIKGYAVAFEAALRGAWRADLAPVLLPPLPSQPTPVPPPADDDDWVLVDSDHLPVPPQPDNPGRAPDLDTMREPEAGGITGPVLVFVGIVLAIVAAVFVISRIAG